ncbi:deferrochelatase/peroxidase EfeB [Branchiibius hedensis]|uniref:Deferrochelatase/peroxidase EfeB n=1 Tax=Branchiibius hedensis TaxID=672460 RepID=A0A2Y8ZN68_9MICO|nr:Dyp-type peroxidase [Branchiibius hedensis]PWJ24578.1 deferrochelatase/peroxidase EfeB [Branchiibius hedensis]SSA33395.1 deferrochelatase/peroxidase EfeB [Branchiibius hedensis]
MSSSAPDPHPTSGEDRGLSRRRLVQGAAGGAAVGALAVGGSAWAMTDRGSTAGQSDQEADRDTVDLSQSHPFYGSGAQAGVFTPPQRHALFMTFTMVAGTTASDLQSLLARWSAAIAQLTQGKSIGAVEPTRAGAVAPDTGEAFNLDPASLTVTIGLGPSLFDDRFGLKDKRPALLTDLPDLPSDSLQPGLTGGDLSLQACADDPQVAYHAIRNLARMVRGTADTHWTVMGFGRASAGAGQYTPRNLMGFKDGTRNITEEADRTKFVTIADADQKWLEGGTYQVVRKIEMDIEIWDADPVSDQQHVFGRTKDEGAPLSGTKEFDTPDFHKAGAVNGLAIPATSHVALAAPENNGGVKILRRGYNYTDGINQYGQLDAGLLFIAYLNDPAHFITLQKKLGSSDRLNEYISHIGSGLFAVPPAPATGHYVGEALFA